MDYPPPLNFFLSSLSIHITEGTYTMQMTAVVQMAAARDTSKTLSSSVSFISPPDNISID